MKKILLFAMKNYLLVDGVLDGAALLFLDRVADLLVDRVAHLREKKVRKENREDKMDVPAR